MKNALAIIAALLLVLHSAAQQPLAEHEVSGIVVDSAGRPVPNAFVRTMTRNPDGGGTVGVGSSLGWFRADDQGRFSIKLRPGTYKFAAKDEAHAYPDTVFMLNRNSSTGFPQISVHDENISGVIIRLGRRGAILQGRLLDQKTHNPVPNGKVTIHDASDVDAYVEVFTDESGHFQFTVPSKPIVISAAAAGYMTSHFANGADVILSPGERRSIVLEMQHQ